jgi:hypothetical protein
MGGGGKRFKKPGIRNTDARLCFLLITVVWHQGTNSLHVTFFWVILIARSMDILGGRVAITCKRILHWIGIEKKEISHA